jgi:hypothetical protein
MLLDHKAMARFLLDFPRRLWSFSEAAFAFVFFKGHGTILATGRLCRGEGVFLGENY